MESTSLLIQRNESEQYLGDSVSVEDFQNFRLRRCFGRSVDISVELSFDNARAHAFSVLINSGAML